MPSSKTCGKKSIADLKVALENNAMLGSFAHGHAVPESIKGAMIDVVTKFFNSGGSPADATKQLVAAVQKREVIDVVRVGRRLVLVPTRNSIARPWQLADSRVSSRRRSSAPSPSMEVEVSPDFHRAFADGPVSAALGKWLQRAAAQAGVVAHAC